MNLQIINSNPPDVLRALEEYSIDVAITYIDQDSIRCGRSHPLYAESYALLTRKGTLGPGKKQISWEEAARLPLCFLAPEMQQRGSLPAGLFGHASPNLPHMETNSVDALYSQVRSGAWSAVVPRSLASIADNSEDLEMVALPRPGRPASVGVVMPDRELSSPLAEAFFRIALNAKFLGAAAPRSKRARRLTGIFHRRVKTEFPRLQSSASRMGNEKRRARSRNLVSGLHRTESLAPSIARAGRSR